MTVIVLLAVCGFVVAQDKPPIDCPKISVVEPPGITNSGENVKFKVEPDLKEFQDLRFEWTVSPRPPDLGQGTSEISVKTDYMTVREEIKAKVVVAGLPPHCPNTAEGFANVVIKAYDIMDDQFGKIPTNDQLARIDNSLIWLRESPQLKLYILLRYKKGTQNSALNKRVKKIKDFIFEFRKVHKDSVLIISEPSDIEDTRLYRLPPGSMEICDNCKVH